jgi:tetrahydrodipicolinate N-succinyltransferase
VERTVVKKGASVGSGATILSNISIGENAIVGAGSVVTKDVAPDTIVAGNPAKPLRHIQQPPGRHRISVTDNIPFLDLITSHIELEQELTAVFHKAFVKLDEKGTEAAAASAASPVRN